MKRAALVRWLHSCLRFDSSAVDLAQQLTLLMFLYYAREAEFPFMALAPVSVAALIAGLIWPRLRSSRWFWLYVCVAVVWVRLPDVLLIDNHHYLIAYWCLAILCSRVVAPDDPEPGLARNARLLVGLAMAFAVVSKLHSGEFADGSFFEFLLLVGERFKFFAEIVAGVSPEVLEANRAALASMVASGVGSDSISSVGLIGGERVALLADLMAIWTLGIELAAAVLFLVPGQSGWFRAARNLTLLTFALTTYAVATVGGFAWILLILGVAQCEERDGLARAGYALAVLLVVIYSLPFGEWLAPLVR